MLSLQHKVDTFNQPACSTCTHGDVGLSIARPNCCAICAAHESPNDVARHSATNSSWRFLKDRGRPLPQPIHHFLGDLCCGQRLQCPVEIVQHQGVSNIGDVPDCSGAAPLLKDRKFWDNFFSFSSNALASWNVNNSAGNGPLGWNGALRIGEFLSCSDRTRCQIRSFQCLCPY